MNEVMQGYGGNKPVSNSILQGIGSPVPLGADRSLLLNG